MPISGVIVLYPIIWFMSLFIALQVGIKTQHEDGNIVPGTPASAPANLNMKKRVFWVTIVATILWAGALAVIYSGVISIRDLDFFGRYGSGHY